MAKFSGVIGYAIPKLTAPGVWGEEIIEKPYRGDILKNMNRWQTTDKVNDNFVLSNRISIISDPFSEKNLQWIKYVNWKGVNWKVESIDILRPRIILSIGGVYNGTTN